MDKKKKARDVLSRKEEYWKKQKGEERKKTETEMRKSRLRTRKKIS